MTISNSNVASHIIKHVSSEIGSIHFFKHIAVIEFKEGVHVDLISFKETIHDITSYFGTTEPFGLICNRINSYSVDILDIQNIPPLLPNMAAYGIVSHNEAGRMNAIIESNFCKSKNICYENLYESLNTIHEKVKRRIKKVLN